jgi:transcription elongation factor GreA
MRLADRSGGLTRTARGDLLRLLRSCRPDLFGKETPPWEEDVIYTSVAGLEKRRGQLDYIANKRLPEVIRELGEAARLGDLSENAEFTAAVEERGRLAAETERMRKEIGKARLISPEMARTDCVTVGARVRARNLDSGEVETLTFLGPWDADPPAGIYSYRAPLALAFMGKRVGEEVSFESPGGLRRWEVLETGPAL